MSKELSSEQIAAIAATAIEAYLEEEQASAASYTD
jgi:hypothetical protein